MFETRQTDDLVRIAAAGGGFELNAGSRHTDDLVRIAAAAAGRGRITLRGLSTRHTDDIVRISAAGKGSAFFAD
jgi:DNA replication protein